MTKQPVISRFSADELAARRARGESQTDLARVQAKTDSELEQDIAADADFSREPASWYEAAEAVMPVPKRLLSLRLDSDLVDWFRAQGPGYQTRMNAVLRSFMTSQNREKSQP